MIADLEALLAKATPGKRRIAMHGYNVKSDLSGTPHDGDYFENVFAVPCGPKAVLKAVKQFQHDAELEVAIHNALPAILTVIRAAEELLFSMQCRNSYDFQNERKTLRLALAAMGEGPPKSKLTEVIEKSGVKREKDGTAVLSWEQLEDALGEGPREGRTNE